MLFDRSARKQEKEILAQITAKQQLYQSVFNTPEGQAVLKDLEHRCFVNSTTLNDNHGQMGFAEGRRSIYVHISNMLKKDLKEILEELTKGE